MIVFFPPLWEHPCAHIHCPLCQKYKILSEVHTKLSKEFSTWTVLPTAMICLSEGELMIVFFPPLWEHPCVHIHCPLCQKYKILSEVHTKLSKEFSTWTVLPTAMICLSEGELMIVFFPPLWEHPCAYIHCPLCQKDKILSEKRWYICNKVDRTVGPTASQKKK